MLLFLCRLVRLPGISVWLVLKLADLGAAGPVRATELFVEGNAETVFAWRSQRCEDWDVPDAPARAFRDDRGTVRLFATHFINRALTGSRLDTVAPDCRIVFQGDKNDDPAAFDDRIWLTAFHTADGQTIHALAHAEYHGHLRASRCPAARYMECWWNAVIQLISTDRGATFRRAAPGTGAVAASPYPYDGAQGHPTGYFSPSNIVEYDGAFYAFVFAAAQGAQRRGACLLRTDRIDDPSRWRAWDGRGFTVRLADAYAGGGVPPEDRVCAPIPGIPSTLTSLTRQKNGTFIGLFAGSRPLIPEGAPVTGVYFITSGDLLHWSEAKLLFAAPMMFNFPCTATWVYAYPSLLDADSPSRTFSTVSDQAYLYLTRFNARNCLLTMDRDLVRYRVALRDSGNSVSE